MYTTPRKVKQESRLRRSLSLTNSNNNCSGNGNRTNNANGIEINGDASSAIPSLTSPYYTLSNRSSHHSHLNGIAEQPVSGSVPFSSSSQSLTDPYSSQKGIYTVDVQNGESRTRFSYCSSNGAVITIPDVIDVSQQPDGSSLHYPNPQQQQQYSGPPPYRNPPRQSVITVGGFESGSSNGHQVGGPPVSPQSVPDSPVDSYHTHSAKFPIVKEVIISETEIRNDSTSSTSANGTLLRSTSAGTLPRSSSTSSSSTVTIPPPQSTALLTPEYIKKFQNKKFTKYLPWKDERRALTLDSETAKELQNQLAAAAAQQNHTSTESTIPRSASAFELEKLIEAFNQEQHALVMSSLQQGLVPKRRLDGIDNPALELGSHNPASSNPNGIPNGHPHPSQNPNSIYGTSGKMAGYSFSDSSASQSLSLSSSNTDSLDTVIYKGPNAGAPSVRDWQRSKEALQSDFGHHRSDTNAYRSDTQCMFDNRSYPMQQASSSYQPMQFNGPGSGQTPSGMVSNGYSMEYRHQQQVQQQQQQQQHNLSVQSVHQSQQQHLHQQQNGIMRQSNGTSSAASALQQSSFNSASAGITQSPMLPTKSPMVTHKPVLSPPGPSPSSSSNQSVPSVGGIQSSNLKSNFNENGGNNGHGGGSESSGVGDKTKDSTKMFPSKTYNHIKDMISSRFGNGGNSGSSSAGLQQKGLNNSNVNHNNANNSTANNNNGNNNGPTNTSFGMNGQNGANSYMDSMPSMPSYGMNQHGHIHSHSIHDSYGGGAAQPYYTGPPTISPQGGGNVQQQQQSMMNGNANSYRSPPMNDRKNVNTSFRKAINHSQNKSNLTEESLRLRPIVETGNQNGSNRDLYRGMQYGQQNVEQNQQQRYGLGHEPPSPSLVPHHVERAQKALDSLVGGSGGVPSFTRTGSGPMTHQNGITRMVQQFGNTNGEQENTSNSRPLYPLNGNSKIGSMSSAASSQLTTNSELGAIPRNRFSVTTGPSSGSTSNSSGGLGAGVGTVASNSNSGVITVESSLSSPSGYTHSNKLVHQAPTTSHASGNSINNSNKSTTNNNTNNNDQPPPLPTSQKPEVSGPGHSALSHHHFHGNNTSSTNHNALGLPVLPSVLVGEKRENGDGSSNGETPSSANLHAESSLSSQQQQQGVIMSTSATGGNSSCNASSPLASNKSKSEQLKKITADLHNLAITVAAENFHNGQPHLHSLHHSQFAPGSSSSECEKGSQSQRIGSGQSHTTSDSGVGTVLLTKSPLNSISDHEGSGKLGGGSADLLGGNDTKFGDHVMDSVSSGNDSEWVDIVEPEIKQILELEKKSKPGKSSRTAIADKMPGASAGSLATSTPAHITQGHHGKGNAVSNGKTGEQSDFMGDISASPILHHKNPSGSPSQSPKIPKKFDLNSYNKKAGQNRSQELLAGPSTSNGAQNGSSQNKVKSPRVSTKVSRSNSGAGQQRWNGRSSRGDKVSKSAAANRLIKDLGLKGIKLSRHAASQILYPHDDNGDVTSTTTGLDLESMLDGQTEQTSDDEDTTIDLTDAHAIRRQLESLESMYTEVLKVLGAKRFPGNRYPTGDLRRRYGSMSSIPSSVSSKPFRERKLKLDDKKKVKDIKSINKRFQRLESHVVTLARSVAHLSSEMRTQHLMVQEIESIRNEMQQLRNQVLKNSMQNQSAAAAAAQTFARVSSGRNNGAGVNFANTTDWTSIRNALPGLANPCRVRKLTKFFGHEPPLVRIFLKKLGYEKYAPAFEQEKIGVMELPYLTEERLNNMGIPMGPRLRILQEAQQCLKPGYHPPNHDSHHGHHQSGPGNLSVYVV